MEEESQRFVKERADRIKTVQERHNREVEEFDVQSATLGMDALHIAEATQDSYEIDDGDSNSVRGSVLSLTPSTSTNSFTHTHTQLWLIQVLQDQLYASRYELKLIECGKQASDKLVTILHSKRAHQPLKSFFVL